MLREPRIPARLRDYYVAGRKDPHPAGTVVVIKGNSEFRVGLVTKRFRKTPAPGDFAWTAEVAGYSLGTRYRDADEAALAIIIFHASYPSIQLGEGECVPRWVHGFGGPGYMNPAYVEPRRSAQRHRLGNHVHSFMAVWRVVRGF
jgi:hypothetical protein